MRKNVILFVSIILLTYSCCDCDTYPIEKYCGGIVVKKYENSISIDLKINGEFLTKTVHEYDFNRYNEGDTIKCSEEDKKLYKEKEGEEDDEEDDIWSR